MIPDGFAHFESPKQKSRGKTTQRQQTLWYNVPDLKLLPRSPTIGRQENCPNRGVEPDFGTTLGKVVGPLPGEQTAPSPER